MPEQEPYFIHPSAKVEAGVLIGKGSKIWHNCHLRENSKVGENVSLGKDVFLDKNVEIPQGCRIQNGVSLYFGIEIERYTFIGPHVIFTNDLFPRVGHKNWKISKTYLEQGSSIGAGSIVICENKIGAFGMVGAGSIVTNSVDPFTLVYGTPARPVSKICACGSTKIDLHTPKKDLILDCCRENLETSVLECAIEASLA